MSGKKKVSKVQEALSQFVGSDVKLKANSGRRRYIERSGVLEGTYSNLFVVRVEEQSVERKMSFSYVDLLTGNVVLIVNRDGKDYRLVVNQNSCSESRHVKCVICMAAFLYRNIHGIVYVLVML